MIWDGQCGFCKYWVIRWQQMTGDAVIYKPYQDALKEIPDIPVWACREAARLVDTEGRIFNGPEAAYKALEYTDRWNGLYKKYKTSDLFRYLSDHAYVWIAKHRNFLFKLTRILWGKDPGRPAGYWRYYLLTIVLVVVILSGIFVAT